MSFDRDIFAPELAFRLEESSSEVDGQHILGKVSGEFFVPEGFSRNKRYYSRGLWDKVIGNPEINEKLKDRRMFGTISHEQHIDDTAILEGKISHVVSKLSIKEGSDGKLEGYGEALILNTPAGRILNTFLRAGSKLFVSSRADGQYKGEKNGVPAVDEGTYNFKTFDFVIEPGFKEANPKLVESLMRLIDDEVKIEKNTTSVSENNIPSKEGEEFMSEKSVEKELFEKVVSENQTLKEEKTKAVSELADAKSTLEAATSAQAKLEGQITELRAQVEELSKYKSLGTPSEIEETFNVSEKLINEYKELGTVEEIKEAIVKAQELVDTFKVLGTPEDIDRALDSASKFITDTNTHLERLGSFEQIESALDSATATIQSYKELGTVEEIKAAFDKMETHIAKNQQEQVEKHIKTIAEELKVDVEAVKTLYGKISEEEIRKVLGRVTESAKTVAKNKRTTTTNESKPTETNTTSDKFSKGRAGRLVESLVGNN